MPLQIILQVLISAICTGGLYGLFASGFTFQRGALKIVDVSYGAWLMVAMYAMYVLKTMLGMNYFVALVIIMVAYYFIGYGMRRFILTKCASNMVQLVATMACTFILQNLAEFIFKQTPRSTGMVEKVVVLGGIPVSLTRLGMFVLAIGVLVGFQLFLNRTWTGKSIRAIVQQSEIASIMGVNAEKTMNAAYGASYMLAAIAGSMLVVFIPVMPYSGSYYQTLSFIICIAAGKSYMRGALYIGILIGMIEAILQFFVARYSMPIIFVAFVFALVLRPDGLFSSKKMAST